jgi:hypothetical protein
VAGGIFLFRSAKYFSANSPFQDFAMRVKFEHFDSASESWESMFAEAAAFATEIGPDRIIGISHSHGGGSELWGQGGSGVVTVWYWDEAQHSSQQGKTASRADDNGTETARVVRRSKVPARKACANQACTRVARRETPKDHRNSFFG